MYQGKQVRRSTGTADRRLAESILAKVRVQIIEGRFFETREETIRTFEELMARYVTEHAARQSQPRYYTIEAMRIVSQPSSGAVPWRRSRRS